MEGLLMDNILAYNPHKSVRVIGEYLIDKFESGMTSEQVFELYYMITKLDLEKIQIDSFNVGYHEGVQMGEELGYCQALEEFGELEE
jgi:hypothetical protein